MPLQEEMFGSNIAGETFFENLDKLLSRQDSHDVADVLEVSALCLLLGYRGRYALTGQDTRPVIDAALDKIRRIRGPLAGLSPSWAVPWVRTLAFSALGCVILGLLLFVAFKMRLLSGTSNIHTIAPITHTQGV
jgi:type VI secretion system protein ImpK